MGRLYNRDMAGDVALLDREAERNFDEMPIAAQRSRQAMNGSGRMTQDAMAEREGSVRAEVNPAKWMNPTSLDAPLPRAGFVQRWIRDGSLDPKDTPHWFKKVREGWQPRDPMTISANQRALYPSLKATDGRDVIRVAGLVLCEMSVATAMARKAAVSDSIKQQTSAVLPTNEAVTSRVTNGRFGPIQVAADNERVVRGKRAAS